ncbi:unnamed protein product [Effrenium voratum]|nr:unnamed protein product [Effrenium voratum]
MLGHLIADSGAVDAENLSRVFDEAKQQGHPDRCYSWILDKLSCERERGNSMYVAMWRLASRRCRFTIMDAPGHTDFSKDIVTAMSQADIAVLVVPAAEELEQGQECEGQLREHTLLAYTLGLRRMVVCVNKMDADAVKFSEERFAAACQVVREGLNAAGLKTQDVYFDVHFVPSSGWLGDNVIGRSDNMPWYCGPTLIEALDETVASHFKPDRPLRFPLQEVMKVGGKGTVVVGRVATGSLGCGARLAFAPGTTEAEVTGITMQHESLTEAVSGHMVSVFVDVGMSELRRGMVGSALDDNPARECSSFLAQVIVLCDPRAGAIRAHSELTVQCHTAQVICAFEELLSRTDRRTGQVLEMRPAQLLCGDAALVRLRPHTPLCLEAFEEYPALGRFSVHDQKITVAVGVVQQVDRGPQSHPIRASVAKPKPRSGGSSGAFRSRHFSADSGEEPTASDAAVSPKLRSESRRYAAQPAAQVGKFCHVRLPEFARHDPEKVRPAMQKLQACFLQLSNGADTVPTHVFRDLLQKLLPQVSELEVNLLLSPCAASATHTDLRRLLSELQLSAEDERERQLKEARREVLALKNVLRRQPLEFTVGQYNILAGYMGNNMEPWFLYGIDMSEARRKEVFRLHGARGSDGKPANPGWPNYVRGILTEEEIRRVEEVHREHFDWPNRKDRLLEVIRDMDVDILSLVECDHYEDHFKPALEELGYDSTWRKRPRPSSADGCCVAWRQARFFFFECCVASFGFAYGALKKSLLILEGVGKQV